MKKADLLPCARSIALQRERLESWSIGVVEKSSDPFNTQYSHILLQQSISLIRL
jgi:hypothetical protein